MEVKCFSTAFPENGYVAKTKDGIFVVDPGEYTEEMKNYLAAQKESVRYILLTHRHADHICGAAAVKQDHPNAVVVIHRLDAVGLCDTSASLADWLGMRQEPLSPDCLCEEGTILSLGETEIKVLHTPGHTVGSVCFVVEDSIFCGDTLFRQSCGRTDFPTGDAFALKKSLRRLCDITGDYILYPGHEQMTTLEYERCYNPFLSE